MSMLFIFTSNFDNSTMAVLETLMVTLKLNPLDLMDASTLHAWGVKTDSPLYVVYGDASLFCYLPSFL